jgi:hypothetical protein
MIPVMWYYPRASRDVELDGHRARPVSGNILTVREYQQRWLGVWAFLSGQPIPQPLTLADRLARIGFRPGTPAPDRCRSGDTGRGTHATVAFPVLGPTRLAAPECGDADDVAQAPARTMRAAADIEAAGLCAEKRPASCSASRCSRSSPSPTA